MVKRKEMKERKIRYWTHNGGYYNTRCAHCLGTGYIEHVGEDIFEACEHCQPDKMKNKVTWHTMILHEINAGN